MASKKSIARSPATERSRRASQKARQEHRKGRNISTKNPVAQPHEQSELQKGKRKTELKLGTARRSR